jgi:hypothetical protein
MRVSNAVKQCGACVGWLLLAAPLALPAQQAPGQASELAAPPITVQIAPPPVAISSAMLGVTSPVGAQSTAGKPVFAEFITEHHQSFTDGNRISRTSTSTIYRDAKGRIRRESQLSIPGLPTGVSASTQFVTIIDQSLGFGFILNSQEMVAHRYDLNAARPSYVAHVNASGSGGNALMSAPPAGGGEAATTSTGAGSPATARWRMHGFLRHGHDAPANSQLASGFIPEETGFASAPTMRIDQPFLAAPNPVRTENLGEQMILGFPAHGTRVITTLRAGEIGNDRPIDIVSEQWYSPELEMVMRSMHRDPWAGEFSTNMVKVSRGDQPAALFEVPTNYKVIDAANEEEHHVLEDRKPSPW